MAAREPQFQQGLKQLEMMAGHPQTDIRLSAELQHELRGKLHALGLDVHDTTGQELYAALIERLKADEARFAARLRGPAPADEDIISHVTKAVRDHMDPRSCFALKSAAAKRLLRTQLPRRTMKVLGYRSADSMLKHESAAALFAAAWLVESGQWAKRMTTSYVKLQASDFEQRDITIEHPATKRWQDLAGSVVAQRRNHVLSFKELGAVVLLPLPAERPPLTALTSAVLALHAINEIRAGSTFLKLHQMQGNFGRIVQEVVLGEPMLPAESLDRPVSWHHLQQYYARLKHAVRTDIFEPVVAAEELAWTSVEQTLASIEPSLEFWKGTAHLGMLHEGHAVSCNLTDLLLSRSNALGYERRLLHHFRQSLTSEILLRYLSHDKLEQLVLGNIHSQLAPALAHE